jgi:hypothetical protein
MCKESKQAASLHETLPSQNLGLQRNILLCTLRYVDVQLDFFTMIYTYTIDMYEARLYCLDIPNYQWYGRLERAPYTKKTCHS